MNITQPIVWLLLFSTLFKLDNEVIENYTTFILPGLLIMTVLTSAGISCGIANYSLRSGGCFYRIYISPVKRSSIVLGQILDVEVLSFIGIGVLVLLSIPLLVKFSTGIIGIILILIVLFLTTFLVSSLSYGLSFVLADENAFIGLINLLIMPLFFISTALMPAAQLPIFFKIAVKFNPFSYIIDCIRDLIINSKMAWENIFFVLTMLLVLSLISFKFAVHMLNREKVI